MVMGHELTHGFDDQGEFTVYIFGNVNVVGPSAELLPRQQVERAALTMATH